MNRLDLAIKAAFGLGSLVLLGLVARGLWQAHVAEGAIMVNIGIVAGLTLAAVGGCACFWLSAEHRLVVALCAMAAVVGAYATEWAVVTGEDKRTKAEVVRELRATRDPNTVAAMYPIDLVELGPPGEPEYALSNGGKPMLPLGGISRALTVHCRELGRDDFGWIVNTSDENGFNNPEGLWGLPSIQVAFLGDSFAHGECVPRDKGLIQVTRERFPATLNLGMPGNGPLLELAGLLEYLVALEPRNVVWVYYENDIADLERHTHVPLLLHYLEAGGERQGLRNVQSLIDDKLRELHERLFVEALSPGNGPSNIFTSLEDEWQGFKDFVLLRNIRRKVDLRLFSHAAAEGPEARYYQLLGEILKLARSTVEGWDGRIHFVYLPTYNEVIRQDVGSLGRRDLVLRVVKNTGIPIIDLTQVFEDSGVAEALWQCETCHYTAEGYALASAAIAEALAAKSGL
jgi:hypothetical protein